MSEAQEEQEVAVEVSQEEVKEDKNPKPKVVELVVCSRKSHFS